MQACFAPIYERLSASFWEVGGWGGQWFAPEPQMLHLFHNSPPFLLFIQRSQSSKQALILPDPLSHLLLPFSQMGGGSGIPCLGMGAWGYIGWWWGSHGDPGAPSQSLGQASKWLCVVWFQLIVLRLFYDWRDSDKESELEKLKNKQSRKRRW